MYLAFMSKNNLQAMKNPNGIKRNIQVITLQFEPEQQTRWTLKVRKRQPNLEESFSALVTVY